MSLRTDDKRFCFACCRIWRPHCVAQADLGRRAAMDRCKHKLNHILRKCFFVARCVYVMSRAFPLVHRPDLLQSEGKCAFRSRCSLWRYRRRPPCGVAGRDHDHPPRILLWCFSCRKQDEMTQIILHTKTFQDPYARKKITNTHTHICRGILTTIE